MNKIDIKPDCVFAPQPMYLVGSQNSDGSPNFCVITWLNFSFDKTPHLMLTMGGVKQSKTNILQTKEFTANLVSEDILWLADFMGTASQEEKTKRIQTLDYSWGKCVKAPVLAQSRWVYECRADKIIELDGSYLILAEIVNIQIDESFNNMDLKLIDLKKLNPVIYSPYNYFSIAEKLGECGNWKDKIGEGKLG